MQFQDLEEKERRIGTGIELTLLKFCQNESWNKFIQLFNDNSLIAFSQNSSLDLAGHVKLSLISTNHCHFFFLNVQYVELICIWV